jgi:hypothetical protein
MSSSGVKLSIQGSEVLRGHWCTRRQPTLVTLYRAGMTNVVLHCLFKQQNQRV